MYLGEPTNFYTTLNFNYLVRVQSATNLKKNLIFFYENTRDFSNLCRLSLPLIVVVTPSLHFSQVSIS